MEKLKKFIPDKISVLGHKVVVSEEIYDNMISSLNTHVEVINKQVDTINKLIDENECRRQEIKTLNEEITSLKKSVQSLAIVLKTYTED